MDAGKLRHRITIQKRVNEQEKSGQEVERWTDLCTVWAQVKCTNSGYADTEGVVRYDSVFRFYIRWRSDITAGMRIKWKNRIFEMTGPPADWESEKIGLTLLAKERL